MKNLKKEYICNIGERNFQMLTEMKRSDLCFGAGSDADLRLVRIPKT